MEIPCDELDRPQGMENQYRCAREALYEDCLRDRLHAKGVQGYKILEIKARAKMYAHTIAVPENSGWYSEEKSILVDFAIGTVVYIAMRKALIWVPWFTVTSERMIFD